MDLHAYEWIVGLGGLLAVTTAYGIGANDVANAFASSVGSGALSIKQAVILAGIFEFSGALLMGSHVTDTIRKGIADYSCFEDDPAILMYGCMCVLAAMSVWLITASYLEMPVSTTHSCVGGMIGMTMVSRGAKCVTWSKETDQFPYVKGVSAIVISWLLSPIVSGIFASFFFYILRLSVLRSENSFTRSRYAFPFLLGSTVCINVFFIVYKGAKFLKLNEIDLRQAGLSRPKISYLHGIACLESDGLLNFEKIKQLDDISARKELCKIRGIGEWTADCYLMASLGRADIWPVGDIGLQESVRKLKNLKERPNVEDMTSLAREWRPFRSIAANLLWADYDEYN